MFKGGLPEDLLNWFLPQFIRNPKRDGQRRGQWVVWTFSPNRTLGTRCLCAMLHVAQLPSIKVAGSTIISVCKVHQLAYGHDTRELRIRAYIHTYADQNQ